MESVRQAAILGIAFATMASASIRAHGQERDTAAAPELQRETRIILLGTGAGPTPSRSRSQPGSLLIVDGQPYLIDAGNGVSRQLVLAGFRPEQVRKIFITHHHIDHNADLPALLSFMWIGSARMNSQPVLPAEIYGPPGTTDLARISLEYLSVSERIFSSELHMRPVAEMVRAHDIIERGVVFKNDKIRVTAVENSHYGFVPGVAAYGKDKSFSFRFETPGRVVVFTGDTGPSDAVAELATGADVLVSEVIDLDSVVKHLRGMKLEPEAREAMIRHMREHHLTPEEIGKIARKAHVRTVLLTHFVPGSDTDTDASRYTNGVRKYFSGEVIAGRDLFEY